jgi:hypothetical protein
MESLLRRKHFICIAVGIFAFHNKTLQFNFGAAKTPFHHSIR